MEVVDKISVVSKYPAYRDSGVEWLGEVPSKWTLTRLGSCFNERKTKVSDQDYLPLSVTKNGIVPQLDSAAKSNDGDNRKLVRKGDFVINSRSDRKGSSGIAPMDGSVSLINIVIKPSFIYPAFCNYLLKSHAFVEENYRIGHGIVADLWTTRYDEMKNIKIALPSNQEQKSIAEFLDDKTSKIDRAIAQKEQMIELLKERKQIIIQNTVTKGLDPNVKMKDSGVDWIGEIPEHYSITKLGLCLKAVSEKNQPDLPLLSITRELGVIVRDTEDQEANHNFIPDDLSGYKVIRKGQFGMNKMKAWQGSYGVSEFEGIISPAYYVFDLKSDINPNYFHRAIRSKVYVPFFASASDGVRIGQWDLNKSRMKEIPLVIPPISEQVDAIAYTENQSMKIERAISQEEIQIEKLKELRSTLIDSAVTGKIKVF